MNIFLKRIDIIKLEFDGISDTQGEIGLNILFSHKVNMDKDRKKCLRYMKVEVTRQSGHEDYPFISAEIQGVFKLEDAKDDLEEIGEKTGEKLFPHLQSYILTITALAGIPPLLLSCPGDNE